MADNVRVTGVKRGVERRRSAPEGVMLENARVEPRISVAVMGKESGVALVSRESRLAPAMLPARTT